MSEFSDMLNKVMEDIVILAGVLKGSIEVLEEEVGLLNQVIGNTSPSEDKPSKVPELKAYNRARNAKALENFLWDMEQYFQAARVPEAKWVTITSMYFEGNAKLLLRSML